MTLYDIVFNAVIIIYLIDNNLLMFISDYKILLIKALNDFYKNNNAVFILDLNNDDLKNFCTDIIKKSIKKVTKNE